MLLYWGVLILAVALLVKWLFAGLSRVAPYVKTAPDVLKERYARGGLVRRSASRRRETLRVETMDGRNAHIGAETRADAPRACLGVAPPVVRWGRST